MFLPHSYSAVLCHRPIRLFPTQRVVSSFTSSSSSHSFTVRAKPWITAAKVSISLAVISFTTLYALDARSSIHSLITMPLIRAALDPELSHQLAVKLAKWKLLPCDHQPDPDCLHIKLWDMSLNNPIGLAAGFDKNGEAIDGMMALGFSSIEIGSITPRPQPGNPKPRVFRLPQDQAVINRYGFNSDGHQVVLQRLQQRIRSYQYHNYTHNDDKSVLIPHGSLLANHMLGINLGKNKSSDTESHDDYIRGVSTFAPFADYLVINVSSPNTPGLRSLQRREILSELMLSVIKERNSMISSLNRKVPICIKIAPDMTEDELRDIAHAALESGIDGLIVSNTTIQRPETLKSDPELRHQTGGLSGRPLLPLGLRATRVVRKEIGDKIPIIGCGGISSAEDALAYAKAGASAIQLYTSLVSDGPHVVVRIKDELANYFTHYGLTWAQVVGADEHEQVLPPL